MLYSSSPWPSQLAEKAAKRSFQFHIDKYPNLERYIDNYQWGIIG